MSRLTRKTTAVTKRKIAYLVGFCVVSLIFLLPFCFKFNLYHERCQAFNHLETQIKQCSHQFEGDFSLIIKDLTFPNLILAHNEDKKFAAASLIKLPLAAVAFKAIEENKISLSDSLIIEKNDIAGGSGIIKKMNLPVKLSLKEVLEDMIIFSDNTATNKIIDILGFDYINHRFKELGLKATVLQRKMMDFYQRKKGIENYTTTSDIAFLLEKIYNRRLVSRKLSQFILSLLLKQSVKDRLPRYLPKDTKIAHKTGLERRVVHDVGIVYTRRGPYIICVLTQDIKKYIKAKKFIAQISLLTYNLYLMKPSLTSPISRRRWL